MLEFKLPDMTCGHCASTVTKTVKQVDPEAKVEVELGSKTLRVDGAQERGRLVQALTEAGYPPAP